MTRSWKHNAAIFLASQALSLLGSSLVQYAMMWHITLKTKSGTMMALYIVCGFLPAFFLAPFAGVWAGRLHVPDRLPAEDPASRPRYGAMCSFCG